MKKRSAGDNKGERKRKQGQTSGIVLVHLDQMASLEPGHGFLSQALFRCLVSGENEEKAL